MVYLKKKRWLLLLRQLAFLPLRADLAQAVLVILVQADRVVQVARLLNKMPLQGKLLKLH